MLLQQAIYGDDGGGHALLASSAGGAAFRQLAGRTDLPGTAPPGVPWDPYMSGFAHQGTFVVVKTFPDPDASRGGMVFAHALFLPLDEAANLADLRAVTDLLFARPVRPSVLEAIDLVPPPGHGISDEPPEGLAALAEALVAREGRAPVVWAGQHGFTEALLWLWARLWPEIRRTFSFRLSFGPQDCQDAPPAVVCTPRLLESRWAGYRLVDPNRSPTAKGSEAAGYLLGASGGERLDALRKDLGARLTRISELGLLEQCWRYATAAPASADERLALVRLLARLSPASDGGLEIKHRALTLLAESVPRMGATQVRALRNVDLAAFPEESHLWEALAEWVVCGVSAPAGSAPDVEVVLVDATAGRALPAWRAAILAGFDRAAAAGGPAFAAALWSWWTRHPALVTALADRLPEGLELEDSLAEACPASLGGAVAEAVLRFAAGRRWLRLHGETAAAAFETAGAVERQLSVDRDPASLDGLRRVFSRSRGEDVLASALRWDDSRLVVFAAEACVAEPEFLGRADAGNRTWRTVFAAAIEREPSVWKALPDPTTLLAQLLELAAAQEPLPSSLWTSLAKTPLGDLTKHPGRSTLWLGLPTEASVPLLAATADGWLARFAANPDFEPNPEPELRREVLDASRVERFLGRSARGRVAEGTELFLHFHDLLEPRFLAWLDTLVSVTSASRSVPVPDATSIGRVARQRGWRRAASRIAELVIRDGRADLRPALHESYPLLSLWERIGLLRSGVWEIPQPSAEELWQLLEQEAVELYPKGPEEHSLWYRAGGSAGALRHDGTGHERWGAALQSLRHGGGGDVTPARLLDVMRNDYRHNERLSWLAGQGPFQDRHHD